MSEGEPRYGRVAYVLWVTLAVNLLIAGLKLGYGLLTGVLSVSADGYHSLLDGCSNVIALVGITLARRPPDRDHHYGHQKYEILSAMGISFLLFIAAGQIVFEAWGRISAGTSPTPSLWGVPILLGTLFANWMVYRYEMGVGKELASPILLSDAEHTRSDMFATVGALVSVLAIYIGIQWIDVLIAGLIGLVIIRAAYEIIGESIQVLTDSAPIDSSEIEVVLERFPSALYAHKIRSRGSSNQVFIDLSLHVQPDLSVKSAHDLSHEIEDAIRDRFPGVRDVVIHIEPEGEH